MNKKTLAGVSLVAAVPAGLLAYFCIHAFLSYTDKMQTMMQVVNGITLLMAVILILTPIVIMLRKGKATEGAAKKEAAVPAAVAAGSDGGEVDADPFDLEAAGDELEADAFDDDAVQDDDDMFSFDDEK